MSRRINRWKLVLSKVFVMRNSSEFERKCFVLLVENFQRWSRLHSRCLEDYIVERYFCWVFKCFICLYSERKFFGLLAKLFRMVSKSRSLRFQKNRFRFFLDLCFKSFPLFGLCWKNSLWAFFCFPAKVVYQVCQRNFRDTQRDLSEKNFRVLV